jgi:hypothetical protein
MKLQHLQNRVLQTIGNFPGHTPICDGHAAFQIPYVYDYITKLCRQQAKSFKTGKMQMFTTMDKSKPKIENAIGLNLAAVMCTAVTVTELQLWHELPLIEYNLLYRDWTERGLVYTVYTSLLFYHVITGIT